MRDDLTLAEQLHRDLLAVRWPEPAEIRARARRRSRRTVIAAAAAVLVVASASAVVAGGVATHRPPSVAATSAVGPTPGGRAEIPWEALLSQRDLPTATDVRLGEAGLSLPVRVDRVLERCGDERLVSARLPVSRYSRSQTLLRSAGTSTAADGRGGTPVLSQDVYRIDPAQGSQVFGELDRLLNACAEWHAPGLALVAGESPTARYVHRWETPVSGFAGDRSVLVRHVTLRSGDPVHAGPVPPVEVTLVIRVRDLVTVIVPARGAIADRVDGTGPGLTYADLTALGRAAAQRMCAAANPPC
ncbi:hypothetical protein ABGB16_00555 [Micromonospora sp. B11E3]|uniref:hypothetical protein n=1 Tax=Micromonospora sp. B11E3 TaxID=3153562 RepID=UPI00325E68B5